MTIVKQGEQFIRMVTLKDAESGDPIDLTGMSAYCQMRVTPQSENIVATATCSLQTTGGRVIAVFPSETTAAIPVGNYGYDIWLVLDGEAKPIYTESVKVVGRYTQNFSIGGE